MPAAWCPLIHLLTEDVCRIIIENERHLPDAILVVHANHAVLESAYDDAIVAVINVMNYAYWIVELDQIEIESVGSKDQA